MAYGFFTDDRDEIEASHAQHYADMAADAQNEADRDERDLRESMMPDEPPWNPDDYWEDASRDELYDRGAYGYEEIG